MLWIWWWTLFVVIFLLIPLGYGWGYRGWGPPSYRRGTGRPIDARKAEQLRRDAVAEQRAEAEGWGWIAPALWLFLAVAIIWPLVATR